MISLDQFLIIMVCLIVYFMMGIGIAELFLKCTAMGKTLQLDDDFSDDMIMLLVTVFWPLFFLLMAILFTIKIIRLQYRR